MKESMLLLLLLVLLGLFEFGLWTGNPMHVPSGFVPARAFGLQVFQELGGSMEPAVPVGRHVLVAAWPYWWREPQVGDVIAFSYPRDPALADLKRIVAAGGSTVEIRRGVLYVDGTPHASQAPQAASWFYNSMPARTIPLNSYFVLGDNRGQSEDSRSYGVIARDRIIGKQWL
jgi:signal peptidase I